jgi:hypothetical protein
MALREPTASETFVSFKAHPVQARFAEAVFSGKYTVLGYGGGIRSGKSFAVFAILVTLCRIFPGSRWAIVRKDLPTIKRNVLPSFSKIRELTNGFVGPVNKQDWLMTCANGSQIVLFPESLDIDPDHDRWKGLEVNGFVLEEANEIAFASYNKAIERAGAWIVPKGEQPPPLILCTFNPSATWVRQVFYDPWTNGTLAPPYFYVPALAADNPHNPADYLENLRRLPEHEYKRFVQGDWNVLAGRFFDELDRSVHIPPVTPPWGRDLTAVPPWWEQWSATDWGFRDAWVTGGFCMDGDGQIYLADTVWCERLSDVEVAGRIKSGLPAAMLAECYAGHDVFSKRIAHGGEPPTVQEALFPYGIRAVPAAIDRVPGWQCLRRALSRKQPDGSIGAPQLVFCDTPGNRRLFEQLAALEHDATHGEDVDKKKAKLGLGDDGADMVRYGIATRIARPTEPLPYRDPWLPGKDAHPEFVPYTAAEMDETQETIGELPYGF